MATVSRLRSRDAHRPYTRRYDAKSTPASTTTKLFNGENSESSWIAIEFTAITNPKRMCNGVSY